MKRSPLALLPSLFAGVALATIIRPSTLSGAADYYKVQCSKDTIPSCDLRKAKGTLLSDMMSHPYSSGHWEYCSSNTVGGQTMYGYASCKTTMLCSPGATRFCRTTTEECDKCLSNARRSMAEACIDAVGANTESWTDLLWCDMYYNVSHITMCVA